MEYKTKNKIALLAAILLCSANILFAQTPSRKLTLQEAIQLGIDNSKSLKISSAKIEQASASLQEAKMSQYPDLKISGDYLRVNNPTYNVNSNLTGGSDSSGSTNSINVSQAMFVMATANLPLFAGFKIHNGIESAKYLKKASELDAQQDKDVLIQNTIDAYYNLYKAQAAVKLVNENLKQAQQRVTDFTNLETNGIIARNDLLKAELQESNIELTLMDAENNLKISNFNMDLMLGIDEKTDLELDASDLGRSYKIQPIEYWENSALSNRADYLALQQRQQAAVSGVKTAKGDYYPTIGLTGGYVAADVPGVFNLYNAVDVGVGLSYNLASLYKNGAKVKEAKAQQNQLYWTNMQMNDGIKMQIHKAYQDYLESLKKIDVYQKAVDQANENYRVTKNKYDNALVNTTELLEADVAQLQAGINYEYAKADAEVAYNKLYETSGIINQVNIDKK